MSSNLKPDVLVRIHESDAKGRIFTLEEPLTVYWRDRRIDVPDGFDSDGASVPRFFWRFVFPPLDHRALKAAIAHDWIYQHHGEWTRKEADAMFYDTLVALGVSKRAARRAWLGVRLFGWIAWRQNENETEK